MVLFGIGMIEGLLQSRRNRAERERTHRRFWGEFWQAIEQGNYDIVIIGDQRATKGVIRFADSKQRKRVAGIIAPHQIDNLVPELRLKKSGNTCGVDLSFYT